MSKHPPSTNNESLSKEERKYRVKAAAFLGLLTGISAMIGFSHTLARAKQSQDKLLQQGEREAQILMEEGTALAARALRWGTLYAFLGVGTFCFGFWKLSGAKNMEEFRMKMGQKLPRITSDKPPTTRTEFDSFADLMNYLATFGKK